MDVERPSWLTKNFLKISLENCEGTKNVDVVNFEVKRAVPKGNNYICSLYRVRTEYKIQTSDKLMTKSLIIKVPITGGLNDFMLNLGIIQKEGAMYRDFLPKLCKLLGDENEYLTPKSYPSTEENVIVMEDLNEDGFKMANRLNQLDFDHTVAALKHLAKFHAASVKLFEKEPKLIECVGKELMFRRDLEENNSFILAKGTVELLSIELSTWPESNDFIDSIKKSIDTAFDRLIDCFEPKEGDFYVQNHGDFWVTNILYKYDEDGKPIKVKFIDLQNTRYASPAIDLIYLFNGSVQEEIRTSKYEELINIYVDELNENLERYGSEKRVNASTIFRAIEKRQFYAFYTNISLLPIVVQDNDVIFEIKEMTEDDLTDISNNPFRKYLQTKKFKSLFLKRIKEFAKVLNETPM